MRGRWRCGSREEWNDSEIMPILKKVNRLFMTAIYNIYEEVAEIITKLDPERIMKLKAFSETQQRFEELTVKYKAASISKEEKDELDHFVVLDRLIRMAKIRAEKDNTNG